MNELLSFTNGVCSGCGNSVKYCSCENLWDAEVDKANKMLALQAWCAGISEYINNPQPDKSFEELAKKHKFKLVKDKYLELISNWFNWDQINKELRNGKS